MAALTLASRFPGSRAALVCAACYSTTLLGCDLGFPDLFASSTDATGTPTPPLCPSPPCCGAVTCSGACCFDGNALQCLPDAGDCGGVLFQSTQCLSAADCCGDAGYCACCLGLAGTTGNAPTWLTECEQDDFFGCGFFSSQVCTTAAECPGDGQQCEPDFPEAGTLFGSCVGE